MLFNLVYIVKFSGVMNFVIKSIIIIIIAHHHLEGLRQYHLMVDQSLYL